MAPPCFPRRARRRRGCESGGATNARARRRDRMLRSGPYAHRLPSHPVRRQRRAPAGATRDLRDPFPPATPAGDRVSVRAPPWSTARACAAQRAAGARPRGPSRQPIAARRLRRHEASPARAARPATASRRCQRTRRRTGRRTSCRVRRKIVSASPSSLPSPISRAKRSSSPE